MLAKPKKGFEPLMMQACKHGPTRAGQLIMNKRMSFHSTKPGSNFKQCRDMLRIARHPAQTARTRIPGSKTACRSPGAISCNSKGSDLPTPLRARTCHCKNLVEKATRVTIVSSVNRHSLFKQKHEKHGCLFVSNLRFSEYGRVNIPCHTRTRMDRASARLARCACEILDFA